VQVTANRNKNAIINIQYIILFAIVFLSLSIRAEVSKSADTYNDITVI